MMGFRVRWWVVGLEPFNQIIDEAEAYGFLVGEDRQKYRGEYRKYIALPHGGGAFVAPWQHEKMGVGIPVSVPSLGSEKKAWAGMLDDLCAVSPLVERYNTYTAVCPVSLELLKHLWDIAPLYSADPLYVTVEGLLYDMGWRRVLTTPWESTVVDLSDSPLGGNIDTGRWVIRQEETDSDTLGYCYRIKKWVATPHDEAQLAGVNRADLFNADGWIENGKAYFIHTVNAAKLMEQLRVIDPRYTKLGSNRFSRGRRGVIHPRLGERMVTRSLKLSTPRAHNMYPPIRTIHQEPPL